ncbi:MAG: DUF4139 domain-containing protein [Bryobacteraceae bacterium]
MTQTVLCFAMAVAAGLAAELPIREVVLYKNGVGYFVRSGELAAGRTARLEFRADEMNDVLKSLMVVDEAGGQIGGLRYDSSEPLEKKLEQFPFRLGEAQALTALLDQLKGARVEVKTGPATASGLIVGAREVAPGERQAPRQELTLLTDSGELRTLDLAGMTALTFADPALRLQFQQYLANLVAGRSKEKRSVYIDSSEGKARRLRVAYVVPAPVWKSSYRLVFAEAGEPTLEGWAIVDNSSGEDWSNVRLALVSGKPVSFISRLYEPRYVGRRAFDLVEEQAAAPEVHRGGIGSGSGGGIGPGRSAGEAGGVVGGMLMRAAAPAPQMAPAMSEMVQVIASSVELSTEAAEAGELFEYRFGTPVTVRQGESVMLPFVQQKLAVRKLLVYSAGAGENPRNAAEITNNTGKTLDGGPVTVFDGNTYAGEAPMETLKAGDKRLISYAVDLGTRITTGLESGSELLREIHLNRGVLITRAALQQTTTYTIRNVDQKAKTLLVEHAIRPTFRLVKMKPAETTAAAYRFEIRLAPGAAEKFPVVEEQLIERTVALVNATPGLLLTYIQNKALDEDARRQLDRIAQQKARIAANDGEIRRAQEQIDELVRDQERLRQNISSLNRVAGQQEQVQSYAKKLADEEVQLAALRDRLAELRKTKAALEAELNELIEKAQF